jgi:hypothetical protein
VTLAVLVALAGLLTTARLTRLISADRVTLPIRAAIVRRWGPSSAPGYLVHCRWCVSMYVAPLAAAAVLWLWDALAFDLHPVSWAHRIVLGALLALAFSHGTALLAGLEDED